MVEETGSCITESATTVSRCDVCNVSQIMGTGCGDVAGLEQQDIIVRIRPVGIKMKKTPFTTFSVICPGSGMLAAKS